MEKSVKPGYKTTEFWMTALATVVGLVAASGVVPDESGLSKLLGLALLGLSQMGYNVSRGLAKR